MSKILKINKSILNQIKPKLFNISHNKITRELEIKAKIARTPKLTKKYDAIPKPLYGGRYTVTMLPGSGVGPEQMETVQTVFNYVGVPVDFEIIEINRNNQDNEELNYALLSIKRNGVAIKGNIETESKKVKAWSHDAALRNKLDLFVNIMNCKMYPELEWKHKGVDIVIIRQNTEGEYSLLEHESVKGVVESMKIITRSNAEKLARYTFDYAKQYNRKKVTTVHKADVMTLSDGLLLSTCQEVAKDYPTIEHNDMLVTNACMHLVQHPQDFDVMIMTNLYGTVISNILCGLLRGSGILSSTNYGDHYAVFEPGARYATNKRINKHKICTNPCAMLNCSIDMLNHLSLHIHADEISNAIRKTLCVDRIHTPDLGGNNTSKEMLDNILHNIDRKIQF